MLEQYYLVQAGHVRALLPCTSWSCWSTSRGYTPPQHKSQAPGCPGSLHGLAPEGVGNLLAPAPDPDPTIPTLEFLAALLQMHWADSKLWARTGMESFSSFPPGDEVVMVGRASLEEAILLLVRLLAASPLKPRLYPILPPIVFSLLLVQL